MAINGAQANQDNERARRDVRGFIIGLATGITMYSLNMSLKWFGAGFFFPSLMFGLVVGGIVGMAVSAQPSSRRTVHVVHRHHNNSNLLDWLFAPPRTRVVRTHRDPIQVINTHNPREVKVHSSRSGNTSFSTAAHPNSFVNTKTVHTGGRSFTTLYNRHMNPTVTHSGPTPSGNSSTKLRR